MTANLWARYEERSSGNLSQYNNNYKIVVKYKQKVGDTSTDSLDIVQFSTEPVRFLYIYTHKHTHTRTRTRAHTHTCTEHSIGPSQFIGHDFIHHDNGDYSVRPNYKKNSIYYTVKSQKSTLHLCMYTVIIRLSSVVFSVRFSNTQRCYKRSEFEIH